MHDLDVLSHSLKILGQQTAMAFFGAMFAAQEAMAVQTFNVGFLRDFTPVEQVEVFCFVALPGNFFITVLGEQVFGGGKIEVVFISHATDSFGKESQILAFCKACELGDVVDAGIHNFGYAAVTQQIEKLLGGFVGEADGVESNHGQDWRNEARIF